MPINPMTNFVKNQMQVQAAKKTEETKNSGGISDKAKTYLNKLKEKFGNVDFIISDYTDDADAAGKLQSGKGEYNCIITPDLLEKMANDDAVASKYENLITESTGQIDEMKETIKEKAGGAENIKNYGISVDGSGKVNYYVLLKDSFAKINSNAKGAEKSKNIMISAGSIEELLKKLEEHSKGKIEISKSESNNTNQKDGFKKNNDAFNAFKKIGGHTDGFSKNDSKNDIVTKLLNEHKTYNKNFSANNKNHNHINHIKNK